MKTARAMRCWVILAGQNRVFLAHVDAAHEIKERGHMVLANMQRYNRDKAGRAGLSAANPDFFEDTYRIEMVRSAGGCCSSPPTGRAIRRCG